MGILDYIRKNFLNVNWESLLKDGNLNAEYATLDFNPEGKYTCAWKALLNITRKELASRSVKLWAHDLAALKEEVQQVFAIAYNEKDLFDLDFLLFSHFIYLSLNEANYAPALNIDPLLPLNEREKLKQHILEVFSYLLNAHLDSFSMGSLDDLIKDAHELTALTDLEYWDKASRDVNNPSIWQLLHNWLLNLLSYLHDVFASKNKNYSSIQLAKAVNTLWKLAIKFHLDLEKPIDEERGTYHDLFSLAFQSTIENFDTYTTLNAYTQLTIPRISSSFLKSLESDVKDELDTLSYWAAAKLRSAILNYQTNPSRGLEEYLEAFKSIRNRLTTISTELYTFRVKAELILRKKPSTYLTLLNALDSTLISINNKLNTANLSWLHEAQEIIPNSALHKASICLSTLLEPAVLELENLNWAAHSTYSPERTEGKITFEMDARRLFPSNYNLKTSYTLTDYLINQYLEPKSRAARAIMVKNHPDKFSDEPLLLPIANFCTTTIDEKRKECEEIIRAWRLSQWFDPNIFPEVPKPLPNEDIYQGNLVKNPELPLTLASLDLKKHYLTWISNKTTLVKNPQKVPMQNELWSGEENPMAMALWNYAKIQVPIQRRDIAIIEQNIAEQKVVIDQQDARIAQQDARIAEIDAETELLKEQENQSILKFINRNLQKIFAKNKSNLTSVDTKKIQQEVFEDVLDIFSICEEQHQQYLDYIASSISTYISSNMENVSLVRRYPAGLFAGPVSGPLPAGSAFINLNQ